MFTVAKAILEVLTVLQELNVIVTIALGTAAVKLAHKSDRSRHTIFSDFRKIRSVQRGGQQLFGLWPSCPRSRPTPGYVSCVLFKVFHKISVLSSLRYFWLCAMSLFFILQYI